MERYPPIPLWHPPSLGHSDQSALNKIWSQCKACPISDTQSQCGWPWYSSPFVEGAVGMVGAIRSDDEKADEPSWIRHTSLFSLRIPQKWHSICKGPIVCQAIRLHLGLVHCDHAL